MLNFVKKTVVVLILILFSSNHIIARPPKPGPDFVWVGKRTTLLGIVIPAHWKYKGKKKRHHKKRRKGRYKISHSDKKNLQISVK
jgi:hypothetical protein